MRKIIHNFVEIPLRSVLFCFIINLCLPIVVLGALSNPLQAGSFAELLEDVAEIVFMIGIPIAVMFIIYAGFLFVTARGSEENLKKAKSAFTYAILGAGVLIGARIIANAVVATVMGLGS